MAIEDMKVAVFVPSLGGGGAERVMILIANGLAARGMSVELLVLKGDGGYVGEVSSSVKIVNLSGSRMLTSLPKLICYLRKNSPNFLVSALDYANVCALLAIKAARVRTKVVITEHSTLSLTMKHNATVKHRLMLALMRYTYPGAAQIVAVSNGVADDLAAVVKVSRGRIATVYNPVVSAQMLSLSHQPIDHPWFESQAVPVILGVGRFTIAKDFATLLRAFAMLREYKEVKLILLGDGELRPQLNMLIDELGIAEDVDMPGFVANPYAWMRKVSVLVMSSAYEGLPTVLIEAMACGIPVVSTDCKSGPAEILENGKWGRMVPVGDAVSLCRAINETLEDSCHGVAVERASQFDVKTAVDRYIEILIRI